MFYPVEGEYMELLGQPPVNLSDSNLYVCELLEINYRAPLGNKRVIVENIVIDSNLKDLLVLRGEVAAGKAMREIFIRMKRLRNRDDAENTTEVWSIRFGRKIVKQPELLAMPPERDYLRLVRRGVMLWLLFAGLALIFKGIGVHGFLAQFIITGIILGSTHVTQVKENEVNRRYALRGVWMVILPMLVMVYANIYGIQQLLT